MREGSLEAPTRYTLAWEDDPFYDPAAIDAESSARWGNRGDRLHPNRQ